MNMPHKYSTVLLDWDDTLWDFRHNAFIALKERTMLLEKLIKTLCNVSVLCILFAKKE